MLESNMMREETSDAVGRTRNFGDASAPRRKHREIVDEVLSRGNPIRWFGSGLAACETASD